MIKLKINVGKKKKEISSEEIREILIGRDDFSEVMDISSFVNESDIMAFDCRLEDDILSLEDLNEAIEEIGSSDELALLAQLLEDGNIHVGFEDLRTYIKDATDEIEADLREKYDNDDIRCFFNVYRIDEDFEDFKIVFVVSFREIGIAYLTSLANFLGRKQFDGASKFYS
ncbi:MAG: hypothetical protein ACRDB0_08315 [Paraclostridium sp.]